MNRSSFLTMACCVLLASPAFSQTRSGSGSSSGRGGGSSGSSSGSFGDFGSGFDSNQQGYQFGDLSQFGQTTGMNALSSGIGSPATGLGLPALSNSSNSNSRTGRSGSPNTSFGSISQNRGGASGGGMSGRSGSTGRSSTGRSVTGMTGSRSPGRTGNAFGMNGMNGMNGGGRGNRLGNHLIGVQQSVRPVVQVSFDDFPTMLQPPAVAQTANTSFAQNQVLPGFQQMKVNVDVNGVATVSGTAKTDHERALAAAMLSLDPGVRAVQNQITVPAQASLPASR